MKTCKMFKALALVLLLGLLLCGCGDTVEETKVTETEKKDTESITTEVEISKADPDAEDTKQFTFFGDREFTVEYKETVTVSGVKVDVYVDSEKNEYKYDSEGKLISLRADNHDVAENSETIDYTKAKTIGLTFALRCLGDDEYKTYGKGKGVSENETEPKFSVTMRKTYGEEDFISGPVLTVDIDSYGNVVSYDRDDIGLFYGYDFSEVDTLTSENVVDALRDTIDEICITEYDEVEVYWCRIEDHDGVPTMNIRLTLINMDINGIKIHYQHEDIVEVHQYNGANAIGVTLYRPLQDILDFVRAN